MQAGRFTSWFCSRGLVAHAMGGSRRSPTPRALSGPTLPRAGGRGRLKGGSEYQRACLCGPRCGACLPSRTLAAFVLTLALSALGCASASSPLTVALPRSKGTADSLYRDNDRLQHVLGLRGESRDNQRGHQRGANGVTPVAPAALSLQQELGRVTKEYVDERRRGGAEPSRNLQEDIDAVIAKWTQTAIATPRTRLQTPLGTERADASSPGSLCSFSSRRAALRIASHASPPHVFLFLSGAAPH
jgi:hypothetical protein